MGKGPRGTCGFGSATCFTLEAFIYTPLFLGQNEMEIKCLQSTPLAKELQSGIKGVNLVLKAGKVYVGKFASRVWTCMPSVSRKKRFPLLLTADVECTCRFC